MSAGVSVPQGLEPAMPLMRPFVYAAALAAAFLSPTSTFANAKTAKPKKPTLTLRATPRMAFSPVTIFLTAELQGGDEVEQFYCPEVEWDWGDGGKSVQEADCAPYDPDVSKIDRRFTIEKVYRRAGVYMITVALKRANKTFAKADVRVTVRPGLADPGR
jgi:hypothetical protein